MIEYKLLYGDKRLCEHLAKILNKLKRLFGLNEDFDII